MKGMICGTGSFTPAHVMDNNDIAKLMDTSDEWIRERTGVARRHIVREETTVSMASAAARRALENGNILPGDVELILAATISSNVILPSLACEVQKEIGADHAACFDLNAACTGFVFAYNTAQAYIASGMYKTILIIGSECLSHLVNWSDRSTCILFGDGAGAAVVKAYEGKSYLISAHSEGKKGDALTLPSRYIKGWKEMPEQDAYMKMDGQEVFKFAVRRVPEAIREVLDMNGIRSKEIDYFVLHQANSRIVEAVAKRLDTEIHKFPMNLEEYGNTSSASIPILLDEMKRDGRIEKGQKIVLAGFGAGLSWGASIAEFLL